MQIRHNSLTTLNPSSCICCKPTKNSPFPLFLCFSCKGNLCSTCQTTLQITKTPLVFCISCLNSINSSQAFQKYSSTLKSNFETLKNLEKQIKNIKTKNKESLQILRELNLSFIKLSENSANVEKRMELRLVDLHEKNSEMENLIAKGCEERSRLMDEVERFVEHLDSLQGVMSETKTLICKDEEKIQDLEILIKEQKLENVAIEETLEMMNVQKKQEFEIFSNTESLNGHLGELKAQFEEARKQNEGLKKRFQEMKTQNSDEGHPRVCFEYKSESYKKMLEQFNSQETLLKDLQLQLKLSPTTNSRCKCDIM